MTQLERLAQVRLLSCALVAFSFSSFKRVFSSLTPQSAQSNGKILERANKQLEDEEKDDKALRAEYGAKWNRVPSTILTRELLMEVRE
jgi:hypothetical protein